MNAKLVLRLWRERWGKGREGLPNKSYVRGSIYNWFEKIPNATLWSTWGVSLSVLIASVMLFLLSISIQFSLNGQISFAGLMVITVLFLRRYDGGLISLILIWLAAMCLGQYFVWRFSSTIIARSDASFFVPLTVCCIELLVSFYFLLGAIKRLWPIEDEEVELFAIGKDAPFVDVLVFVGKMSQEQVLQTLSDCNQLVWPAKRLKVFAIDSEPRPDLEESLEVFGVTYLSQHETNENDVTSKFEPTLARSTGDYLLLLDQPFQAPKEFLERVLGWLSNDGGLSMLYSANHSLAPKVCPEYETDAYKCRSDLSFTILRRSAWQGELAPMWKRSALVVERAELVPQDFFSTDTRSPTRLVRIDRADSDTVLSWKVRVMRLHQMLNFYGPVAQIAFLFVPLAYLLQGWTLIKAQPEWFACFAVPALVLMSIVHGRKIQEGRWAEFREIKELLLSGYMLLATARSYLQTALMRPGLIFSRWRSEHSTAERILGIFLTLILILNVGALGHGVVQFFEQADRSKQLWTLLYCLWALVNVLLLLCREAMLQESAQIKWFAEKQQKLPAMIRLPFGRTLACQTVNFPAVELGLIAPINLHADHGAELKLSIFHNEQIYSLTVQSIRTEGLTTYVCPKGSQESELTQLRDAVFARGKDWPMWLPHRNADHPLPDWLSRFLASIPGRFLDVALNLSKYLRLDGLIQLWKSRK
jgi:cellulose synthase (UDP-forming)